MRTVCGTAAYTLVTIVVLTLLSNLSYPVKSLTYLKFSDQTKNVLREATHFATLKSGVSGVLQSNRFTICGSVFIRYFRFAHAFYTVRKNNHKTLWFSLRMEQKNSEKYDISLFYFGNAKTGAARVSLRPHAWSHACTSVDLDTGNVIVAVNGIVTHDINITSHNFRDNVPIVFERNLVLGLSHAKFSGTPDEIRQSEVSVTNVNIFSAAMASSEMIRMTSTGHCTSGDVLSWTEARWNFTGNVETLISDGFCEKPYSPNLFLMAKTFDNFLDCAEICSRFKEDGRIPLTLNISESVALAKQFKEIAYDYKHDNAIWSSFVYKSPEHFIDFYTKTECVAKGMWIPGQPNGGKSQPCTVWEGNGTVITSQDPDSACAILKNLLS